MKTAGPAILILARRLIALEASKDPSDAVFGETRVCDKLRIPLTKFAGVAGFRSLMARAYVLAAEEFPCLDAFQVRSDGSLEIHDADRNQQGGVVGIEAGTVVLAQLLGLLIAFVGEPMMMHLVCDTWPDADVLQRERLTPVQDSERICPPG